MIDLLIGIKSDPVVTAKLLWGSTIVDDAVLIRDYLTNKALSYRDEAMTISLPEALQAIVPQGVDEAKREDILLFTGGTTSNSIRRGRFLEHLEDKFYANMAEVIRQKFPERYNTAENVRRVYLEKRIRSTQASILESETRLSDSNSPREKSNCESELLELRRYLDEYKNQLEELTQKRISDDHKS